MSRFLIILFFIFNISFLLHAQEDSIIASSVSWDMNLNRIFNNDTTKIDDSVISKIDTINLFVNDYFLKNENLTVYIHYYAGFKIKAEAYYDNMQAYRISKFKNGIKEGLDQMWYKNGKLQYMDYKENGMSSTPTFGWYESGELKSYTDDANGIAKQWYKNGFMEDLHIYIDTSDNGYIGVRYFENGQLYDSAAYNIGAVSYYRYYETGDLMKKGHIYNATISMIGKWEDWYSSGIKKKEYFYDKQHPNQPIGTWSYWNEEGKLVKQEKYKDGELVDVKEFLPYNGEDQR